MCQAVRDGGRRCPVHQHQNIAFIKGVAHLSGLNRYQTERLFAELRRTGRDTPNPTAGDLASQQERLRVLVAGTEIADEVEVDLGKAHLDTDIDGATLYAQRNLHSRALTRAQNLLRRFEQVSQRTGLTVAEVKAKFNELRDAVDTSRGAAAPAEFNQNTRRAAFIADLPYDQASVVALERLNQLAIAERKRRVTHLAAPAGSHLHTFGYDEGRLEVTFTSSPDQVFAYRNIPENVWERFSTSPRPGHIYATEIRGNADYMYEDAAEAEGDAYRLRCASCGQFRAAAHECPSFEKRKELEAAGVPAVDIPKALEAELPEVAEVEQPEESTEILPAPTEVEEPEAETVEEPAAITPASDYEFVPAFRIDPVDSEELDNSANYPNWVTVADDNALLTPFVPTVENQRIPVEGPQTGGEVAEGFVPRGEGRIFNIRGGAEFDSYYLRDLPRDATYDMIHNAPSYLRFVISIYNNTMTVLNTFDSRTHAFSEETQWWNNPGTKYTIKQKGKRVLIPSFTAEELQQLRQEDTDRLHALIREDKAVIIDSTSTETTKYSFDANWGRNPKIKAGNATAFKRAIKDGKIVIMSVQIRTNGGRVGENYIDDQGYTIENGIQNDTIVHGDIAVRRNADGVMEVISSERQLKCNCMTYRRNYNCSHINYAQRHFGNVAQQMIPLTSAARGERGGHHPVLTAALANRRDVKVIDPAEGSKAEPIISFGQTLDGTSKYLARHKLTTRRIVPTNLLPADVNNPTPEEIQKLAAFISVGSNLNGLTVPNSPAAIRAAVRRADTEVPVKMSFTWDSADGLSPVVEGTVTIQKEPNPDALNYNLRSHTLKCSCPVYQRNYRCKHTEFAEAQAFAFVTSGQRDVDAPMGVSMFHLSNVYRSQINHENDIANLMRRHNVDRAGAEAIQRDVEERERLEREAREAEARRRREEREREEAERRRAELERMAAINAPTIAETANYRARMMDRWKTIEDGAYSENPEQFFNDYRAALSRKRKGEAPLPFRTENVTDGICDPNDPGARRFGVEIEFDIKPGVDSREAIRKIGKELHEAGLTQHAEQSYYHTGRSNGWDSWSFESDVTVAGELVSPIMSDSPEHWQQLQKAVDIITRNGGVATTRAGSHVHVSTASYEASSAKHTELLRTVTQNEDILFRMASDPQRGKHRGMQWCAPNVVDESLGDVSEDVNNAHRILTGNFGHGLALNFESAGNNEFKKSNVEFRLWDATLDAAVIQQQVVMSVAMTDYAERQVINNKGAKKPETVPMKVGTNKAVEAAKLAAAGTKTHTEETFVESHKEVASFFDKLFRRKEDRAAAAALFAITNWQQR